MMNKRGQGGLSINTIIVAIIAVVVLLLIVAFFTGGISNVSSKIGDIFGVQTAGSDLDLVRGRCSNLCESAKLLDDDQWKDSSYCKQTFDIEINGEDKSESCYNGDNIGVSCGQVTANC